ncbi:hypothetical protein GCM10027346_19800 [Hymenobacter seoulensis]
MLLSLGLQTGWAASAPIYSNTGPNGSRTIRTCTTTEVPITGIEITTCFGRIDSLERVSDTNFNSGAIMNVPTSLVSSSLRLRVDLASMAPANYRAGFAVERIGGVLNSLPLSTANVLIVRTYLKNGTTSVLQEEKAVDATLVKELLGSQSGKTRIEFLATKPFDQLELEAASLLSLNYNLKVYYGYAIDANVVETALGYVSRFAAPTASSYSTSVSTDGLTVCVNSNVSNPLNAVDQSLTNYATLGSLLDVSCPTTFQTQLEGAAPAGYHAGFVLGSNTVLDARVLDELKVTTYLGGVAQESGSGAALLDLNVLPNQQYNVNFATTKPFDRVEIQRTSLASVTDDLRLYYGFGVEPRVFEDQAPLLSEFVDPAGNFQVNNSLACIGCSVTNPGNAADQDVTTNYATIKTALALGGTTRLKLRLDGAGRAGNVAGAVLGLASGLLDVNLLSNIKINTYSGGTGTGSTGTDGSVLVESASGSSFLKLELLADGRQEVSFLTTRDFDWVEIEIDNGVALLNNTQVYYGFAEDRPVGFPTTINRPAPLPVQLVAFTARTSGTSVVLHWQTASELNSSHFLVERAIGTKSEFKAIGRLVAAGNSTGARHYTLRDADASAVRSAVLYYRLRQVDLDGKETFSEVAVVQPAPQGPALTVFPSPASATEVVRAEWQGLPAGAYQLMLYNMQGRLVSQQTVSGSDAALATSALPTGLYQVVLVNNAGQQVAAQRLLVQGR